MGGELAKMRGMPAHSSPTIRRFSVVAATVLLLSLAAVLIPAPPAVARSADAVSPGADAAAHAPAVWMWPLDDATITRIYQAPAHEYGPGHRGVDLRSASTRQVRAPRAGVVAFSGRVVDRGILTIDHGDGYVTTLEPVDSPLSAGTRVVRGELVGTVAAGGHAAPGTVHFGVRLNGEYLNPRLLFGKIPRAVLLPCCS